MKLLIKKKISFLSFFMLVLLSLFIYLHSSSLILAADSWSTGTAGGTARGYFTSFLYDGKIYSWGGTDGGYLNTVDIYDIENDSWSTGTAGGTARAYNTSVLYDGKIYIWGGIDAGGVTSSYNTVDIYDIENDSWSTGTAGGTARTYASAVEYDGKIYIWGGVNQSPTFVNTVDIYDIAGDSWSTGTAGGTARYFHSSNIYNGKIYIWAGYGPGPINTLDIYDIAGDSWSTGTAGGTARSQHSSIVYNGKIYFWAGYAGSAAINTLDIYDIAGDSWSTGTSGGTARYGHMSNIYKGSIYSWGGKDSSYFNTVDIYDTGISVSASLDSPSNGAASQSTTLLLKTTANDLGTNYLNYKIELCTDSGMSENCQIFDQASSQTGWSGQDAASSTAYASGTQAVYTVQTALNANTTYYWRSYFMDPIGTYSWSETQTTPYSFTTVSETSGTTLTNTASATEVVIQIPGIAKGIVNLPLILTPLVESNTNNQKVLTIYQPGTFYFDAFLSSNYVLPNTLVTPLTQSGSNGFILGEGERGVLAVKTSSGNYYQVGNIQNIWYKAYPVQGSQAPVIIPDLQTKSSIIALKYEKKDLLLHGYANTFFPEKNLKLAHSIDGITWRILPNTVLDIENNTVAVVSKVGGYYTIMGKY
ncbi:Kelch repeat-containing protein [Patescibacteria group bacterium]